MSPTVRYILFAVQAGLVLATAYFLTRAVMLFVTPQSAWTVSETAPAEYKRASSQTRTYAFTFDPFHREAPAVKVEEGFDAPETSLNLKMVGRRAGEGGSAIIQTPDRKQGVYRVGDEIISGVVLKTVTPDYIVLSLNGRLERLTFERADQSAMVSAMPGSQPAATPNISAETLMSSIYLERAEQNGRSVGFRIKSRQAGLDLSSTGLRTGDIVTRIGNQDLTTGRPDLQKLLTQLSARSSTNVELIRDGQRLTVKVGK